MTIVDRFGALFDQDGLLIDTEWVYCEATIELMKEFGVAMSEGEYYDLAGMDGEGQFGVLIPRYDLDKQGVTWQQLAEIREPIVEEMFATKTLPLMPYALEALDFFNERQIPYGICSNGALPALLIKAERTGILDHVSEEHITSLDDIPGLPGKPQPHIYLRAMEKIGITRGVIFEDTAPGALAGVRAGLQCFGVPNKHTQNQKFPDVVVVCENLEEAVHKSMDYR
ncbi:HAD family phosphatase [Candidatus Woesearchaeota archaeon]|nr:HAD family phosphatase [Candidatus Woesearchaeota archaeon]